MNDKKSAFDIPKTSSFSKELETYSRRGRLQSKVVSNQRKKGVEPMQLHLAGSGKLKPQERA